MRLVKSLIFSIGLFGCAILEDGQPRFKYEFNKDSLDSVDCVEYADGFYKLKKDVVIDDLDFNRINRLFKMDGLGSYLVPISDSDKKKFNLENCLDLNSFQNSVTRNICNLNYNLVKEKEYLFNS